LKIPSLHVELLQTNFLPSWFDDDETKHNIPNLPVTKEQVKAERLKFMELNARPTKKVAEAKAKKKIRATKKIDTLKQQAQAIADNEEMSMVEKNKQLESLYRKSKKIQNEKRPKVYAVTSRGGVSKQVSKAPKNAKVVKVDARMKKDKRNRIKKEKGKGKRR